MPRYRHPRVPPDADGDPGFAVSLAGETVPLDSDGCFETDAEQAVRALAQSYGTTAEALRVGGDGDDLTTAVERGVCPWCDDYEGDHVGQHASSAHPDEWDAFTTD